MPTSTMTRRIILHVLIASFGVASRSAYTQTASTAKQPSLVIRLEPAVQGPGDFLKLHVKVTNVSGQLLRFASIVPMLTYDIKGPDGNAVPEISQGTLQETKKPRGFAFDVPSWVLSAGQTTEFDEDIGKRYQMKPLQLYLITAQTRTRNGETPLGRSAAISIALQKPSLNKP